MTCRLFMYKGTPETQNSALHNVSANTDIHQYKNSGGRNI